MSVAFARLHKPPFIVVRFNIMQARWMDFINSDVNMNMVGICMNC